MADCDVPSFSLGLDTPPHSPIASARPSPKPHSTPHVSDSDPDTHPPRPILKRLRRGPPSSVLNQPDPPPRLDADDDDIEDFSSQDHPDQVHSVSSAWNQSVCSSSKVSLNGSGVLTPHSSRVRKRKQVSDDIPASSRLETGVSGLVFPKLTTSPLRRFQLLDSDSDYSLDEDVKVSGVDKVEPSSKGVTFSDPSDPSSSLEEIEKTSFYDDQKEDLWKDFSPVKNVSVSVSVPTPAFNELCDEYFRSAKGKEVEKSGVGTSENCNERYSGVSSGLQRDQQFWESADPLPPAHRYFFHEDPRIQRLVRNRLHNFSPLGVSRMNQQPNVSHIDYMGQFSSGGASKTQGVQSGYINNSTRGKNKSNNLFCEQNSSASGGWVDPKIVSPFGHGESSRKKATKRNSTKNTSNVSRPSANWVEPKSCTSMPKDAGKRRVQASGQPAGHWYTSSDGRRVYVNKSGQELTGRIAYRQYRKESGAGFKKSKKKTGAKKTNAKKRN